MMHNGETVKLTGKVTSGKNGLYLANPEFEKMPDMPIDAHDTLFKKVAIIESFWVSVFWQYLSLTIFGLLILLFVKKFRKEFLEMFFHDMGKKVLFVNFSSEILYILGNLANSFATLLAPLAIVLVVSSYQPLFVFIGGILLTKFLPHISTEKISRKHFYHKLISILIIIIGSYFLYTTSH